MKNRNTVCAVLGHGSAALVTLYSFYSSPSSHLFLAAEAPVYCATALAALLGAAIGTWLRQVSLLPRSASAPQPQPRRDM